MSANNEESRPLILDVTWNSVAVVSAALMDELHQGTCYRRLYDKIADQVNGFPGLWQVCVDAAYVYVAELDEFKEVPPHAEELDFIEGSSAFVGLLTDFVELDERLPTAMEYADLWRTAFKQPKPTK